MFREGATFDFKDKEGLIDLLDGYQGALNDNPNKNSMRDFVKQQLRESKKNSKDNPS